MTPQIIENKLVDFYLKKTGPYGHSVMRSIDVSDENLIKALVDIENPIETFVKVIGKQDKNFDQFLCGNYTNWSGISRFRYIVFLCYIAAQDGETTENFRIKLQKNLNLKSAPVLKGVNSLFENLSIFTDKNQEYRQVEIPQVPKFKLIGVIFEFTFPNWRLKSLLNKNLYGHEHTPETLKNDLLLNISEFKEHQGLYQAIQIFAKRVTAKNIFLEEDPFWNFYLKLHKAKNYIQEEIFFYLLNNLSDSYFDLGDNSLKVSELHDKNSTFFYLKKKNKSFLNRFFMFRDLGDKYELLTNINRFEEIDTILFYLEDYNSTNINTKNDLNANGYCFLEVNYKNLHQIKSLISNRNTTEVLPALQLLSSFKNFDLLSLSLAPIVFEVNFNGRIEFIHPSFKEIKTVKEGQIICLPHMAQGALSIILTTDDEYCLSQVKNFVIVNNMTKLVSKFDRKELDLYEIDSVLGIDLSPAIEFNYKLSRSPQMSFFEELLELIYFNSINGISESNLLKMFSNTKILSKFNPYIILNKLKHYGYMDSGYHKSYKAIKWWIRPLSLHKIKRGEYLIQGFLSKAVQKNFSEKLDLFGIQFLIKQIDLGKDTFPLKVIITSSELEGVFYEYFNNYQKNDNCKQVSFLSGGESFYKSFDILKFGESAGKFLYIKEYNVENGIYMLRQKDKKKCNVYELIHNGKSIISTYCRDQVFDLAYQYGYLNLIYNDKSEVDLSKINLSHKVIRQYFSNNGQLPYLDFLSGSYYYPHGLALSLKNKVDVEHKITVKYYNVNRHRKHIRFRA